MSEETTEDLFRRYGEAYRWLATVTAMVGAISMVLSSTIVNVAFPNIMGEFGIGQDRAQWISTGFLAAMTVFMLVNSWVQSVLGQRRSYILVLALFIAGAVLGGTAQTTEVLIFGRVIQGACAGIVQPLAMTTVYRVFPENRRGLAMGIFGLGVVVAPAIGPYVGGVTIEELSWRFVFFLPLPFCIVGILAAYAFLPHKKISNALPPFDWIGFALLCAAISLCLFVLANGQREGWRSDQIVALGSLATLSAVSFVIWEWRCAKLPLLRVDLLLVPEFTSAVAVAFVFGAAIYGSTYLVPIFVQTVLHFPPAHAGLLLMPGGALLAVIFPMSGWLADSIPPRVLLVSGFVFMAIGSAQMAGADVNTTFWAFVGYTLVQRFGLGLIHPTLNATGLRTLPQESVSAGAGMLNFFRQLGGSGGVLATVIAYESGLAIFADAYTITQTPSNWATAGYLSELHAMLGSAGLDAGAVSGIALHHLGQAVLGEALTQGFSSGFWLLAEVGLIALIPAWIMGRRASA
jgi:EmrB/QacA subfamily drug resistance transporter